MSSSKPNPPVPPQVADKLFHRGVQPPVTRSTTVLVERVRDVKPKADK